MTQKIDGVDTSNNQGARVVDIGPQLLALAIELWMHKATQSDSFRDRYWPDVRANSEALGFRYRGPYHWLQPNHAAASQFAWFEAYVGDLHLGECVQLDVEDPGGLPDTLVFDFIDLCEERWPGRVIVYTGRYYMPYNPTGKRVESYLIDRLIARYGDDLKWWLPWYASTYPAGQIPTTPVVWQWAGGATGVLIEGVGRIDSNEIIDRARLDLLCGYGATPDPPHPPDPNPDPPLDPQEDDMFESTDKAKLDAIYGALFDLRTDPPSPGGSIGSAIRAGVSADTHAQLAALPAPGAIDLSTEANRQALIGVLKREFGDLTIVANEPYDGKFHFEQA